MISGQRAEGLRPGLQVIREGSWGGALGRAAASTGLTQIP